MKISSIIILKIRIFLDKIYKTFRFKPTIYSSEQSLNYILENKCSVARFGDGEFDLILGRPLKFQNFDPELSLALKKVLISNSKNCMIGIPDALLSLDDFREYAQSVLKIYYACNRSRIMRLLSPNKVYLNSNMTRFWTGYKEKALDAHYIVELFKKIWDNKDIVIIEGKKTRMGVGNDLFDNAKSISRILCPEEDAWCAFAYIWNAIEKHSKTHQQSLWLLALGPTATVLAFEMSEKLGLQALDLGHLDIQYEYMIRNTTQKILIPGKYVNEVTGGDTVDDINNLVYINSIIEEI